MTEFVLATANAHKATEMRAVLEPLGFTLLDRPRDVDDVEETEDSLEGNALLKARALAHATQCPAVADDTGLFVDFLHGRPGVHSARYAGANATYAANVAKLLGELAGASGAERNATFRTVLAVVYPDDSAFWVEGVLPGRIGEEPRGDGGFGYDPVFIPRDGDGRTLAELSGEDKNSLSHRGRALRALVERLAK